MAKTPPRGKKGQIILPPEPNGSGLAEKAGFALANGNDVERRLAPAASIHPTDVLATYDDRETAHLVAAAVAALEDEKQSPTQEAGVGERPPMEIAPDAEIWP